MIIYRIANWDALFETAETRKLESLKWVPTPNKHDGLGFKRMAAEPDGCQLGGAWCAILQVASKGKKHERGMLIRDGQPLTAEDLALMVGYPKAVFERALEFFSGPRMGWIVAEEMSRPGEAGNDAAQAGATAACPATPPAEGRKEGTEGIELKEGNEQDAQPSAAERAPGRFKKPTIEELNLHAATVGLPASEVEKFFNHYESNGWRVGRNPMKSWQAALVNWRTRSQEQKNYVPNQSNRRPVVDRNAGTANEGRANDYKGIGRL